MAWLHHDSPPRDTVTEITRSGRKRLRKDRTYHDDGTITSRRRTPSTLTTATDVLEFDDARPSSRRMDNEESLPVMGTKQHSKEKIVVSIDLGTNNTIVGVLRIAMAGRTHL